MTRRDTPKPSDGFDDRAIIPAAYNFSQHEGQQYSFIEGARWQHNKSQARIADLESKLGVATPPPRGVYLTIEEASQCLSALYTANDENGFDDYGEIIKKLAAIGK